MEAVDREISTAVKIHPPDKFTNDWLAHAFREVCREQMKLRGLNQSDLALAIGMSRPAVSMLLRGERDGRVGTWQMIFNFLQVRIYM